MKEIESDNQSKNCKVSECHLWFCSIFVIFPENEKGDGNVSKRDVWKTFECREQSLLHIDFIQQIADALEKVCN